MTTGTPLNLGTGADIVGRLYLTHMHPKNWGTKKLGEKLYRDNNYRLSLQVNEV